MGEDLVTEDLMAAVTASRTLNSIIMVVGVGGAGGNAVDHMWSLGIEGVSFMVCNTDKQALNKSSVEFKVQLGEGLGAGNDPQEGHKAAVESIDIVRHHLESLGVKMLFITAGMGGGTGTGASPVIAKLAREMGLLTVAIVTSPLAVEGRTRYDQALAGIEELRESVDSLLVINNENISKMYGRLSLKQAFGKADDILASAAKGIAEIITVESDLVNVDFADVSRVIRNSGRAHMSVARADGEDRAEQVAQLSLQSPLLEHTHISGAKNILLNISVANIEDLILDEVTFIMEYIQSYARVQDDGGNANIIWGTSSNPSLGSAMELVVIATGFKDEVPSVLNQISIPGVKTVHGANPSILEPIKPIVREAAAVVLPEQVTLGAKSPRYTNIEALLNKPAYRSRNAKFIVEMPAGRKEIMKDERKEIGPEDDTKTLF